MREFHDTLRCYAKTDKLMTARDIFGYIQMVLAPEFAMWLIMDDMKIDEEQARVIMIESEELGELLHGFVNAVEDHDDTSSQQITKGTVQKIGVACSEVF
jgi:hypothetical protein